MRVHAEVIFKLMHVCIMQDINGFKNNVNKPQLNTDLTIKMV